MFDPLDTPQKSLTDRFGRRISYVRLSVTDRCDLRCTYCMAENMVFLPKPEVLSLEELLTLSDAFIKRGVDRIRLTGGEPLVRRDILWLIRALGDRVKRGDLREVTLTTNGTQLDRFADDLADAGVKRLNISLDTLDADRFRAITRRGDLDKVLTGIDAAKRANLHVKINMVVMRGTNTDDIESMLHWCAGQGFDLTLIETMPLGPVESDRGEQFMPLNQIIQPLKKRFGLTVSTHKTGGPAVYYDMDRATSRLGLITPLTGNFCSGCNRIRVTCTGRIYMCLGQDDHIDLRAALRQQDGSPPLDTLIDKAMGLKPEGHGFAVKDGVMTGEVGRHMSHTGG